jgi:hypothetical protein
MADLTLTKPFVTGSRFSIDDLRTEWGCRRAFDQLTHMSDEELGQEDIGLVNLLCAVGLPSADLLDIPHCLETVLNNSISWRSTFGTK